MTILQNPRPFPLLLLPPLSLLNYTLRTKSIDYTLSSNISNPRSLAAQLRSGAYDSVNEKLILSFDRWQVLPFSYPFDFSRLHVGIQKPARKKAKKSSDNFLFEPFDRPSWIAVGSSFFLLVLVNRALRKRSSLLRETSDWLFEAFVGIVCAFYLSKLEATTIQGAVLEESMTFEFLAKMVAAKKFTMITSSLDNFRFEYLNMSTLPDVLAFVEALEINPPLKVRGEDRCDYLLRSNDSSTYFKIDTEANLLSHCATQLRTRSINLLLIPIPGNPMTMASIAFSGRADRVRQKISRLAVHGMYETEKCRIKNMLKSVGITIHYGDDGDEAEIREATDSFDTAYVIVAFWPLFVGCALAFFVFALEKCAFRRRRTSTEAAEVS